MNNRFRNFNRSHHVSTGNDWSKQNRPNQRFVHSGLNQQRPNQRFVHTGLNQQQPNLRFGNTGLNQQRPNQQFKNIGSMQPGQGTTTFPNPRMNQSVIGTSQQFNEAVRPPNVNPQRFFNSQQSPNEIPPRPTMLNPRFRGHNVQSPNEFMSKTPDNWNNAESHYQYRPSVPESVGIRIRQPFQDFNTGVSSPTRPNGSSRIKEGEEGPNHLLNNTIPLRNDQVRFQNIQNYNRLPFPVNIPQHSPELRSPSFLPKQLMNSVNNLHSSILQMQQSSFRMRQPMSRITSNSNPNSPKMQNSLFVQKQPMESIRQHSPACGTLQQTNPAFCAVQQTNPEFENNVQQRHAPQSFNAQQPTPFNVHSLPFVPRPQNMLISPLHQQPVAIGNGDKQQEYRELMVSVVSKWLQSKAISKKEDVSSKLLKIHEYREMMTTYVTTIDKLRVLNDSLAEHMEADTDVWNKLIKDVQNVKTDVVAMQSKLFDKDQVKIITILLKQRKKKRDRIKRNKRRNVDEYVTALSKRIKLNEKIDEWQHKEQAKILTKKMIDSLRNEAGESLVEVKRKQTEALELMSVFNSLKELRDIRKETAIYKGILVTEEDNESFDSQIESVTQLLPQQKKIYEDEERALRVLREEETEQFNRIELEKRKKRKKSRQQDLNTVDPMFSYRLYWLQGEESIAGLIHVRSLWDMYLCPPGTPDGTSLPKGWLDPCAPSSKEWQKYLVKQNVRKKKSEPSSSRIV